MKNKEVLIKLVKEWVALAKTIDFDDDNDDNSINDELNSIGFKIEEATIPVFGHKVSMDFGMINAIFENPDLIIKAIEEYEK